MGNHWGFFVGDLKQLHRIRGNSDIPFQPASLDRDTTGFKHLPQWQQFLLI